MMSTETKATHTPGEWEVIGADSQYEQLWVRNIDGSICSITTGNTVQTRDEKIANARLIAAAPETKAQRDEFREALEAVVKTYRKDQMVPTQSTWFARLEVAISSCEEVVGRAELS